MPRPDLRRCTGVLRRVGDLSAQFAGGSPAPVRFVQQGSRQGHEVGFAFRHDAFGLAGIDDQAYRHYRDLGFAADLGGKGDLVAGGQGDLGAQGYATARGVNEVAAALLQDFGEGYRFLDGPAALDPVGRAEAEAKRAVGRPDGADGVEDFQGEAGAAFEVAAVAVGALVGQGRQKGV